MLLLLLPQLARAALQHFNNPFAGVVALPVSVNVVVVVNVVYPVSVREESILEVSAVVLMFFYVNQCSRISVCVSV